MIVMGDFNTAPRGYPQHYADESGQNTVEILMASKQVTTQLPGLPIKPEDFTFPSENPGRVIDWIFVSSPWKIQEQRVIQSDLSDHLPVIAQLSREEGNN
jgi:endonuclease/exonuclease/phosphatase family metal-dependent hydrolase